MDHVAMRLTPSPPLEGEKGGVRGIGTADVSVFVIHQSPAHPRPLPHRGRWESDAAPTGP